MKRLPPKLFGSVLKFLSICKPQFVLYVGLTPAQEIILGPHSYFRCPCSDGHLILKFAISGPCHTKLVESKEISHASEKKKTTSVFRFSLNEPSVSKSDLI